MESEQPVRRAERPEPVSAVCIRRACLFKVKPERNKSRTTPEREQRVEVLKPVALNVACKSGHWGARCVWWTEWLEGRVRESWRPGEHRTRRPAPYGNWVKIASFQESEPA